MRPGPRPLGGSRWAFSLWAPEAKAVSLRLVSPAERTVPMARGPDGGWTAEADGVEPGALYLLSVDGRDRPDPASRHQPRGVRGPSRLVSPAFPWSDSSWRGLPLERFVLYELHVGTFTAQGTFAAAAQRLPELAELGVTAVELMPVAQFPGERGWGYDGALPYAVQDSYGGPEGLKGFVDAAHRAGLAVVVDAVYNHLGPEGNALWGLAPYFTDRYRTPWGTAVNYDGPDSDRVREYFIENALYWLEEFRADALRLDAVHAIPDFSASPFLKELADAVRARARELGRPLWLIAESDQNDPRLVRGWERGGLGLDAVWNDDFHHALRVLLTGRTDGYYRDFGGLERLAKAYREGFVYTGQPSLHRGRRHGQPAPDLEPSRFVVFAQNHDQVGNSWDGARLSKLASLEKRKLAAAAVLLSPYLPLLFMGEEYGETAPFLYFTSHSNPGLIDAVRQGRREEFKAFSWAGTPPDPQAEETFLRSKLDHSLKAKPPHSLLLAYYKTLLRLRREVPALSSLVRQGLEVECREEEGLLTVLRRAGGSEALLALRFGGKASPAGVPLPSGTWTVLLESSDSRWGGPGRRLEGEVRSDGAAVLPLSPDSATLLVRMRD